MIKLKLNLYGIIVFPDATGKMKGGGEDATGRKVEVEG